MEQWNSVEDVLDYAIQREQDAVDLYMGLAETAGPTHLRSVFEGFAAEEQAHKDRLIAIKRKGMLATAPTKSVTDLKIGDYLVTEEPTGELDYQGALILAMKREKAAYKLYSDLASIADSEGLANVFLRLAQEEARHKLRFEIEYDENILVEN